MHHVGRLLDALDKSSLFLSVRHNIVTAYEADTLSGEKIGSVTNFAQINDADLSMFNSLMQPMHIRNVSNLLKHYEALKTVSESTGENEVHLIIEDDVVFGDRVAFALADAVEKLPTEYDMTFIGLPSAQLTGQPEDKGNISLFSKFYNVAPVCESYFVSVAGAKKLIEADQMLPMKFPTNVQLSYAIKKGNLSAFFTRPNVFIDGSKLGVFLSSIDANNQLLLSTEHQAFAKIVEAKDLVNARVAYDAMRFKAHPDTMRLMADLEHAHGNYKESKQMFDACYRAYKDQNCILTSTSKFMKSYIVACADFA